MPYNDLVHDYPLTHSPGNMTDCDSLRNLIIANDFMVLVVRRETWGKSYAIIEWGVFMSIKGEPKYFQPIVANDELLDAIDVLNGKISQCIEAGLTKKKIQHIIDEYHKCHVNYPLIRVLE